MPVAVPVLRMDVGPGAADLGRDADSVPRFLPLFEPFDEAILTHQSRTAVRHGDETVWRIQSLKETG